MRACNHCGSMTLNSGFTCMSCGEPAFRMTLKVEKVMTSELRPAVEVAKTVRRHAMLFPVELSTAIIEADREAVRAEQAAEIERLNIRLAECSAAGSTMRQTVEELHAEREKWKALAETLAGAGEEVADAAYHGDECPMDTTGAYCNCGYDAAYEKWCQSLTSYKEQRDAD